MFTGSGPDRDVKITCCIHKTIMASPLPAYAPDGGKAVLARARVSDGTVIAR